MLSEYTPIKPSYIHLYSPLCLFIAHTSHSTHALMIVSSGTSVPMDTPQTLHFILIVSPFPIWSVTSIHRTPPAHSLKFQMLASKFDNGYPPDR